MIRLLTVVLVGALVVPTVARAQTASDLLGQGIRAYAVREYDGGAWLLRRALAFQGADALPPGDAARALMYLAATELSRNQRDSALAAARRLIVIDPKFRPDDQVFSPQAIALYQEVRRSAPTVSIRALGDTAIRPGVDAFSVRLAATTTPEVTAALTSADGRVVRTLYNGLVRDSLDVRWNGLDVSGNPPPSGRYAITVTPTGRDRRGTWTLRLPLEVVRPTVDTTPLPPAPADSLLRPEQGDYPGAWRALIPGVLAGAAIVVLPKIVASGESPSNARLIVGGTVTVAGIAAFLSHRPGRTLPGNSQYNRNLRESWRRNVADITRRNAERVRQARMVIRPASPVLTASEAP
jgi:hypothetical protein